VSYKNIVKKAKSGDYYSRTTLVYDVHLEWLMKYVEKLEDGKMIEAGVARGGCLALCHYANPKLKIIGLDSWEPMPPATEKDDRAKCDPWTGTMTCGKIEDVATSYKKLGASSKNLTLIKGWLEDTIPNNINMFENLDILRIDTDLYSSVIFTLRSLFPKVKSGGLIILDDWHFNPKGVRGAVNDYFKEQDIDPEIHIHTKGAGPAYFFKK
jgi:hypothetical protein